MDACLAINQVKDDIEQIVELTEDDKREHGIMLCKMPDGSIETVREIYSTENHGELGLCPLGTENIGSVHTHPDYVPMPSELDILSSLEYGIDFTCVADKEKAYCVVFNKQHEDYDYYRNTLLTLHDAASGANERGNHIKAIKISESIESLINEAIEKGVFELKVCKL